MNEIQQDVTRNIPPVTKLRRRSEWSYSRLVAGGVHTGAGLDEALLNIVADGDLCVSVGQYKDRAVRSGELFLVPPMSDYVVEAKVPSCIISCTFHMDILIDGEESGEEMARLWESVKYDFNVLEANGLLKDFIRLQEYYVSQCADNVTLMELKKQELFMLIFALYDKGQLADFFYPVMGEDIQFKNFVMSNHVKAKNVQELAALANYSASGFIKKFRRCFNESPYKWMSRQKADSIVRDISSGLIPLKEIAMKYNFSSYQHFAEFCKSQCGGPPTEILNRLNVIHSSKKPDNLGKNA